jgi:hypothetical protein
MLIETVTTDTVSLQALSDFSPQSLSDNVGFLHLPQGLARPAR